jgi:hypothetical protein
MPNFAVEVRDNGSGISASDFEAIGQRHCTHIFSTSHEPTGTSKVLRSTWHVVVHHRISVIWDLEGGSLNHLCANYALSREAVCSISHLCDVEIVRPAGIN